MSKLTCTFTRNLPWNLVLIYLTPGGVCTIVQRRGKLKLQTLTILLGSPAIFMFRAHAGRNTNPDVIIQI